MPRKRGHSTAQIGSRAEASETLLVVPEQLGQLFYNGEWIFGGIDGCLRIMFDKISITCFAASYFVVLLLEVSRIFFRSGVRGVLMVGFAVAGVIAQLLDMLAQWQQHGQPPLASEADWYLMAALMLMLFYLFVAYYHAKQSLGVFFLPLVLGLIAVAILLADPQPFHKQQGTAIWAATHGLCLVVGSAGVMVGFLSGVMYLIQAWRLKHKKLPRPGLRLPSLEWLQKINARAIVFSLFFLLGGFISCLMLSKLIHEEIWWTDPVVASSSALVGWMVLSATFNAFYKPARQGRKVAYLTLANFLFLLFALVGFLLSPRHGKPIESAPASAAMQFQHSVMTADEGHA